METLFQSLIDWINGISPGGFFSHEYTVISVIAVVLVSLVMGAVGSLVVGNRMSFFSDALAHCSFAGVAFGLLLGLILGAAHEDFKDTIITIMVVFGVLVGLLIAFVQERSGLPSDTVIGVFFAAALGLGAIFMKTASARSYFSLERFLFGDLLYVSVQELVWLFYLATITWIFLVFAYNTLAFSSFNLSMARSRQLPVRLSHYLFVALLGLVVNLSLQVVGVLLVNALLIVPAATAANFTRNMRQLFWWTIGLCLLSGLGGIWLSWEVRFEDPANPARSIQFGSGGVIVCLSVVFFVASLVLGPRWKQRRA